MINKEFFIKTLQAEIPTFIKVIKAVPKDKFEYKANDKARTPRSITMQLSVQPGMISKIVRDGILDFSVPYDKNLNAGNVGAMAEKTFAQALKDLREISDQSWENDEAKMLWEGGEWKSKKFQMAWGTLFDAIHHRGQLSTYIRILGGKVPSIYGGSVGERI